MTLIKYKNTWQPVASASYINDTVGKVFTKSVPVAQQTGSETWKYNIGEIDTSDLPEGIYTAYMTFPVFDSVNWNVLGTSLVQVASDGFPQQQFIKPAGAKQAYQVTNGSIFIRKGNTGKKLTLSIFMNIDYYLRAGNFTCTFIKIR